MKEIEEAKEILSNFKEFEIYGEEEQEISYDSKENEISLLKKREKGLAFRVIEGGHKIDFCIACFPNWQNKLKDITYNLKNWSELVKKEDISLPEARFSYRSKEKRELIDESALLDKIRHIKDTAQTIDKRVRVKQVGSSMVKKCISIWSNKGVDCTDEHVLYTAEGMALAVDKDAQIGFCAKDGTIFNAIDAEEIGRKMASRAIEKLGAKTLEKGTYNIVLSSRVMRQFLSFFSSAFEGDSVLKHATILEDRIGTKIVSALINIIDDGTMESGVGTSLCDCEGIPTQKTKLVENGILKNFLHNSFTSKELKYENTANAFRENYRQTLKITPTNIYIENGVEKNILLLMNNGLYITELLGLHTANQITGDFSVGISGQKIKNGRKYEPFRGATMAGNILTLLSKVFAISERIEFLSAVGAPDIGIEDVSVGG